MNTENLFKTVNRLTNDGYTDDFKAEKDGLRSTKTGTLYTPESLTIEESIRFEGETNPDDEAVVFALKCPKSGVKGTYITAYGTDMDPLDIEMVNRLDNKS